MPSDPTCGSVPTLNNSSTADSEIAYFEKRLNETAAKASAAAGASSHASHTGLAELYQLKLSELRQGPAFTVSASSLLEQAREAGVLEQSPELQPMGGCRLGGH